MREAIKEDEGGNQRRAPPVWKGPHLHISVAISGTQWQ
jgi:hypothetical protein